MTYRSLSRVLGWVIAVTGLGVLVYVATNSDLSRDDLNLTAVTVLLLLATQFVYLITESLRMQTILERAAGLTFDYVHMFRVFVLSRMLNLAIPQSGNVYRIAEVKSRYGAAITETTGGVLTFAWLSVALSLAAASVLSFTTDNTDDPLDWRLLLLATVVVIALPILVMVLSKRIPARGALWSRIRRLARSPIPILRNRTTLTRFVALWLASVTVIVVMYSTAFAMVGPVPGPAALIALYALIQVTSFVVITPGNIGIQDIGFAAIAVWFGSDPAVASAAALIVRVSGVVVTAAVALVVGLLKSEPRPAD